MTRCWCAEGITYESRAMTSWKKYSCVLEFAGRIVWKYNLEISLSYTWVSLFCVPLLNCGFYTNIISFVTWQELKPYLRPGLNKTKPSRDCFKGQATWQHKEALKTSRSQHSPTLLFRRFNTTYLNLNLNVIMLPIFKFWIILFVYHVVYPN